MSLEEESDAELLQRIRDAGSEEAFRALFRRHTPALWGLALRLNGGDEDGAEDAVQEAWVRAANRVDRFEGRGTFRSWVSGFVVRVVREMRRRSEPPSPPAEAPTLPDPTELETDLGRAFARMPPRYREVVSLVARGFKHAEVADMLGISPGTSKSQLARGRAWLRAALEGER